MSPFVSDRLICVGQGRGEVSWPWVGQVTNSCPELSVTELVRNPLAAGPCSTAPVEALKSEPWQGQTRMSCDWLKRQCTRRGADRFEGHESPGPGLDDDGRIAG